MQRELDHMTDTAARQEQQLRDAEDELVAVAEEKDKLAPQLEEARWRGRQLERELADAQVRGVVGRDCARAVPSHTPPAPSPPRPRPSSPPGRA